MCDTSAFNFKTEASGVALFCVCGLSCGFGVEVISFFFSQITSLQITVGHRTIVR